LFLRGIIIFLKNIFYFKLIFLYFLYIYIKNKKNIFFLYLQIKIILKTNSPVLPNTILTKMVKGSLLPVYSYLMSSHIKLT
jgi:hypothetical protein